MDSAVRGLGHLYKHIIIYVTLWVVERHSTVSIALRTVRQCLSCLRMSSCLKTDKGMG